MAKNDIYSIEIKGLENGIHKFSLAIGEAFVSDFEVVDYVRPALKVKIALQKDERLLRMDVSISGSVDVECDRCLEWFTIPIKMTDSLLVIIGNDKAAPDTDENVLLLPELEDKIDLGHFLYESVQLALPIRRIHPEKRGKASCNAEMLAKLEESNKLNETNEVDPRWAALKNLKF